jgi:hypothetical protein
MQCKKFSFFRKCVSSNAQVSEFTIYNEVTNPMHWWLNKNLRFFALVVSFDVTRLLPTPQAKTVES